MRKGLSFLIICVLAALVLNCSGCKTSTVDRLLTGIKWILESIQYTTVNIVKIERTFSILFKKNGEVDMVVDCNVCSGPYETGANNSIFFSKEIACTEAYCGDDSKDGDFHAALDSASKYIIEGNKLRIYYNNSSSALNFTTE